MTIASQEELKLTQQRIADLQFAMASARRRLGGQPQSLAALLSSNQHELDSLNDEVREYLGLPAEREAPYEIRFGIDEGNRGIAPMSMFEKVIVNFRGAMTAIAEQLSTGKPREAGRPFADISRLVDFRVTGMAPGSVRLLLEPPLQRGLPEEDLAEKSFGVLEDAAAWVDSGGPEPEELKEPVLRTLAVRQVYRLAPTELDHIAWIELSGPRKRAAGNVRLSPMTSRRAVGILEPVAEEAVEVVGQLREIDLDKGGFEIRTSAKGKGRMKCEFTKELLEEALGYIGTQRIVVARGRRVGKVLHVVALRPSDQP